MAGMQYYFFPTDFYYPKPVAASTDDATPAGRLPLDGGNNLKSDDVVVAHKYLGTHKIVKAPPLTIRYLPAAHQLKGIFRATN
ncbi:hypothetical protein C2S52_010883 [Perilla frutescens var. hirtella]|nr:hypothetical protein C2S52_010883 [Perilla frutescens var. hirtella]KAH6817697.1 hypothetical protein C2S51_001300 [Perilla frutescens var. frutescens]